MLEIKAIASKHWKKLLVGLGIPTTYFLFRFQEVAYLDGMMGDWLATMLGLVFGIPIALEIERWLSRHQRRTKQVKVLALLQRELEYNHSILKNLWAGGSWYERGSYMGHVVKDDLWRSITESGEAQWIDDVELVDAIAHAYIYLGQIRNLSSRLYDRLFIKPDARANILGDSVDKQADMVGGMAEVHLETAIERIKDARKDLPDYEPPGEAPEPPTSA